MLKIAVFGFYGADETRVYLGDDKAHLSPVNTGDFMHIVWQMEPPETRIGTGSESPCFVKLTRLAETPIYVQSLHDRMAPGAALLNCQGYIAIIDAVKILAPKMIQNALRRLAEQQSGAHVMIAAGRQNEPEALSADEIRDALGLHRELPVYPYIPSEPKTVERMIRRLVRYVTEPHRAVPPVFADQTFKSKAAARPAAHTAEQVQPEQAAEGVPRIRGLGSVAVTVSDLARALDFYRGLLGFQVIGQIAVAGSPRGLVITHLEAGGILLELFSYADGTIAAADPLLEEARTGLRHLSVRVTGLDAIAEQLACAGVPFTLEAAEVAGGMRVAFVSDPDGTPIALVEGQPAYDSPLSLPG